MSNGNTVRQDGLDRCPCGCKYWEHDRCIDCGGTEVACPTCGRSTEGSEGWSTGQCDDCYAEDHQVPADWPVQPLGAGEPFTHDIATCGQCGRSWDDSVSTSMTPTPGGRCPFEYFH